MLNVFKPSGSVKVSTASGDTPWSPVKLSLTVRPGEAVFIEWPEGEPMENVIAMMVQVERGAKGDWRAVFDPEDEDLTEVLVGGYRMHGMFVNQIV